MQEINLIGQIKGSKPTVGQLRIYLSAQVLGSLKGATLAGVVEPIMAVGKVEVRTAYGNIAFPENEFFIQNKKVQIELKANMLELKSDKASLVYEVRVPSVQKSEAPKNLNIPHLLTAILELQNAEHHHTKLTEEHYLAELPSAITRELSEGGASSNIWHLTQNLSHSLFFLPLNILEQDLLVSVFKKNHTDRDFKVFSFEWEHDVTGFARLDAMFYYTEHKLEFSLASQKALPEDVIQDVRKLLDGNLELLEYQGSIKFRNNITKEDSLITTLVREHCLNKVIDIEA